MYTKLLQKIRVCFKFNGNWWSSRWFNFKHKWAIHRSEFREFNESEFNWISFIWWFIKLHSTLVLNSNLAIEEILKEHDLKETLLSKTENEDDSESANS